jgi:hypothetical protein
MVANADADAAKAEQVDAILDQLAGVGRPSHEVEAELDAAAAARGNTDAAPADLAAADNDEEDVEPSEAEKILGEISVAERRALAALHRTGTAARWLIDEVSREVAELAANPPRRARRVTNLPTMKPGGLRAEVVAWLRANPDTEITPAGLSKQLGGRSSGAIANALEKLVEAGEAVRTSDKPKRYQAAAA